MGRGDIEKTKRKVEGELRMAQESVNDLEAAKREMERQIGRREKDITAVAAKLEDEQGIVGKLMKGIKEHQGRVEELEEELEAERQARARLRGRGVTWPRSSRSWVSVLTRLVELPWPRSSSTRSRSLLPQRGSTPSG